MFTKKSKDDFFYNILEFIQLFLMSLLLYFLMSASPLNMFTNPFLNDLIQNWMKSPIKQIFKVENNQTCPENATQLFTYLWEGTEPACDCRKNSYFGIKAEIYPNVCSPIQTFIGCNGVRGRKKRYVNKWKDTNLCVERMSDLNYLSIRDSLGHNGECKNGYKQCGVDTRKFKLCFPESVECPINKISFTNSDKVINPYYTKIDKLNDDWYLHTSNKHINDTLIIDVKYSEGRVCINPSEANFKENHLRLKGDSIFRHNKPGGHHKCITKLNKLMFDQRYESIDTNSKFKFYQENELLKLVEVLPQLNAQDLINTISNIHQRSFIYWSPFCNKNTLFDPKTLIIETTRLSVYDGYLSVYKVKTIALLGFYITFIPIFYCIGQNKRVQIYINIVIGTIIGSFVLSNFLLIIFLYDETSLINHLNDIKCGDIISNQIFQTIGGNFESVMDCCFQILYINISLLALIIIKTL